MRAGPWLWHPCASVCTGLRCCWPCLVVLAPSSRCFSGQAMGQLTGASWLSQYTHDALAAVTPPAARSPLARKILSIPSRCSHGTGADWARRQAEADGTCISAEFCASGSMPRMLPLDTFRLMFQYVATVTEDWTPVLQVLWCTAIAVLHHVRSAFCGCHHLITSFLTGL